MALNLAYLNLRRWRYRAEVKSTAEVALTSLQEKSRGNGSSVDHLDQSKGLRFLAGQTDDRRGLPFFINVFHWLYNDELDIKMCLAFSLMSVFLLSAGVAHNLSIWAWLLPAATGGWAQTFFYLLMLAMAMPALFVLTGRSLGKRAKRHAANCESQLAALFVKQIAEVSVPVAPPPRVGGSTSQAMLRRAREEHFRRFGRDEGEG